MNGNAGKNYLKIHNQLNELGKQVHGGADEQKSLFQECKDFEKNYGIKIDAENISLRCENEFKLKNSKLLLTEKKCVILGRTSSGKSTLINALLTEEVLPTNFGSTSNGFVEIKASPTNRNYLVIKNEERNIEELEDLSSLLSDTHLENGSHVTMYYDKSKCQLLTDDVVIIDTPGYDSGIFDNNLMKGYFDNADIVVLVVNAQTGINEWDKTLVKNFKTTLAQLNFVILYNFCDIAYQKDHNGSVKAQSISKAKNILCDILNIDVTQAHSSIFFVCASERLDISTNKISVNTMPISNERNESFDRFFDYLEIKMSESLSKKKNKYIQQLKSTLKSSLDQCQNCISQMKDKKEDLEQNINKQMETMKTLHKNIHTKISLLFHNSFERCLIKALDLFIKDAKKLAEKIRFEPRKYIFEIISFITKGNIHQNYRELLEEITKKNFKNLKDLEENYRNKDISPFQQMILNEIYFPFYFNLNKELDSIDIEAFKEKFMKIIHVIICCTGVTSVLIVLISSIAGAAVAEAFGVVEVVSAGSVAAVEVVSAGSVAAVKEVSAGIAAAVKEVSAGIAAAVKEVSASSVAADSTILGSIVGWIFGIIASFFGINAIQLPFRFAWKSEEAAIRNLWNMSKLDQMKDYSTFINYTIANVEKLITEKASKIQNDLDNIDE